MKDPSLRKSAGTRPRGGSGHFAKGCYRYLSRFALTLLILGAIAISGAVANDPPVALDLTPNMTSPQDVGSIIMWTASATDPDGDPIQYRFWLKGPSTANAWVEKRGWSTVNTWSWTTTNADVGANQVNVWVRDGNHAPASSYDSFKIADFAITAQNQPPVANSLNPDRASPQSPGTSILWTASATDPDGDPIQYRFWLKGPSTADRKSTRLNSSHVS